VGYDLEAIFSSSESFAQKAFYVSIDTCHPAMVGWCKFTTVLKVSGCDAAFAF